MNISETEMIKLREEIKAEILEEMKREKENIQPDPFEEKLKKYR